MRFIVLPRDLGNIIVDVERIIAVDAVIDRKLDENNKVVRVNDQTAYEVVACKCDVTIAGYNEGDDGVVSSSVRVHLSQDEVMQCVFGIDTQRDWRASGNQAAV